MQGLQANAHLLDDAGVVLEDRWPAVGVAVCLQAEGQASCCRDAGWVAGAAEFHQAELQEEAAHMADFREHPETGWTWVCGLDSGAAYWQNDEVPSQHMHPDTRAADGCLLVSPGNGVQMHLVCCRKVCLQQPVPEGPQERLGSGRSAQIPGYVLLQL